MVDATLSYSTVEGELANGDNLPAIPADKIGLSLATNIGPAFVSRLMLKTLLIKATLRSMKLAKSMMTNWQPTATQISIFPPTGSRRLMRD